MPQLPNLQTVTHVLEGGWATDFGQSSEAAPRQDGTLGVPFLVNAENIEFGLNGGPRKMGGTRKLNETPVGHASVLTACVAASGS